MDNNIKTFFEFVRYCIDDRLPIPAQIVSMDWEGLFLFMQQQALTGIGYLGIEKLKREGVNVPKHIFLQWYALSEKIKSRNIYVNKRCVELTNMLKADGFNCCILKGQGNTLAYPHPYVRIPGDIDVFTTNKDGMSAGKLRKTIVDYVRQRFPKTRFRYRHIDYPIFADVEVEMHFIPTARSNPIYNYRIQKWVESQMPQQYQNVVDLPDNIGAISIPTTSFNLIYQMSHIMQHFFCEGIGLRQMMDYYFVLKEMKTVDKETLAMELKRLGMYKFAGAVMYVMQQVFNLEGKQMIVPVDVKRGKTLMEEILKGGNFGQHSGITEHSIGIRYLLKILRNMRFVREYPAEALCEPVFRTWHFFWRLAHR